MLESRVQRGEGKHPRTFVRESKEKLSEWRTRRSGSRVGLARWGEQEDGRTTYQRDRAVVSDSVEYREGSDGIGTAGIQQELRSFGA